MSMNEAPISSVHFHDAVLRAISISIEEGEVEISIENEVAHHLKSWLLKFRHVDSFHVPEFIFNGAIEIFEASWTLDESVFFKMTLLMGHGSQTEEIRVSSAALTAYLLTTPNPSQISLLL